MRPYASSLSQITAAFPGAIITPRERRDGRTSLSPVTETGTVPDSSFAYTQRLEYDASVSAGMTVTVGGVSRTVIDTGTPNTAQVLVNWDYGLLIFNAADAGGAISCTYTPKRTILSAMDLMQWEKELAAVETMLAGSGALLCPVVSVNAGVGGDHTLWNPAVKSQILEVLLVRLSGSATTEPAVSLWFDGGQIAPPADSITLTGILTGDPWRFPPPSGRCFQIQAGNTVKLVVNTAANATLNLAVVLLGYKWA